MNQQDDPRALRRDPLERERELRARMETAQHYFRAHRADVEPDAGFAARVVSKLDRKPVDILGGAAIKLLPATLALVLVLAWFAFQTTSRTVTASRVSDSEDYLTWILGDEEEPR